MSEIVDILSLPIGSGPTFQVNTTGPLYVEVVPTQGTLFQNALGHNNFQGGDSIICLSCGFTLPENFVLSNMSSINSGTQFYPSLEVLGYDLLMPAPHLFTIPIFGNAQGVLLPMSDFEFTINGFYNASQHSTPYSIQCTFPSHTPLVKKMRISMVNVPAALNGVVEEVGIFMKILHSLPMV
jgi:hypothetical protein